MVGWRWGEGGGVCLALQRHRHNDFCIQMGSGESQFNVSLTVVRKVTTLPVFVMMNQDF